MNRSWVCNDVWMDIFPLFDRVELGLNLALLSDRFDVLVDAHFDGREFTIWREILIRKDIGSKPCVSVRIDGKWVEFPLPEHPLPNKIRFNFLRIDYLDYSVITFLHANKHIWDRMGTKLTLAIWQYENEDVQPIWDVLASETWHIFATSIRNLRFTKGDYLDKLRRLISPTILTDSNQLNSIDTDVLFPDAIADDGPNATAGQALTKWLHTPSKNGQPKRLFFENYDAEVNLDWVNSFKETFASATASVSYNIRLQFYGSTPIGPFELVNKHTKEKLTLMKHVFYWLLKRCPISEKAATVQWENDENWDDKLNTVQFNLWSGGINFIGPLSPPLDEKEKEAGQNNNEMFSTTPGPSGSAE